MLLRDCRHFLQSSTFRALLPPLVPLKSIILFALFPPNFLSFGMCFPEDFSLWMSLPLSFPLSHFVKEQLAYLQQTQGTVAGSRGEDRGLVRQNTDGAKRNVYSGFS